MPGRSRHPKHVVTLAEPWNYWVAVPGADFASLASQLTGGRRQAPRTSGLQAVMKAHAVSMNDHHVPELNLMIRTIGSDPTREKRDNLETTDSGPPTLWYLTQINQSEPLPRSREGK